MIILVSISPLERPNDFRYPHPQRTHNKRRHEEMDKAILPGLILYTNLLQFA